MDTNVNIWQQKITIPTYAIGQPEKNPIFLEKRIYQGSSGAVYPHAVVEKIEDTCTDKEYTALFLENEYLKIMILPELGGRVQRAYDKIRKRDFVYYNQVIKPALVGLTGPWISGGIEFNWPQHHRPSTFLPLDYLLQQHDDGSKTVWINEVEIMFRTKCQTGFTLYPGKAYLEIKGRLFNRSVLPQTFLWWANPAVKVNDHYQSVFPPDVHAVYDHGKRDVSDFPIATGTYYNVDYAPGTNISMYKNIPVPTSYMAIKSKYNFMGGYEHDTQGGLLHIANHHISPGKKQWTWGNGDFGKAWDRNLTDNDGPYIELMTGMFTDNQPDFSWLQPNEEKTFEQYFMPYYKVGMVKNATKEALINVEVDENIISLKVYATAIYNKSTINILDDNNVLLQFYEYNLSPENIFEISFKTLQPYQAHQIKAVVINEKGKILVEYKAEKIVEIIAPNPAKPALPPAEIITIDALYINGLHIEQYRHATYVAKDYYEEALRREPEDSRCNNAMGLWWLRRGQFDKALSFFKTAINTITSRNPNPYDGEAYYNLGLILKIKGYSGEAYDAFFKATWNDAFQHNGFLQLARIDAANGNYEEALSIIEKSLVKNYHSHTARHLKTMLLRKIGFIDKAIQSAADALVIDPFNYGCRFEEYLLLQESGHSEDAANILQHLSGLMRNEANTYIEYALDYAQAGQYNDAILLLQIYCGLAKDISPMVRYHQCSFAANNNKPEQALALALQAFTCSTDYCFPNKLEDIVALQVAAVFNPADYKNWYYQGNFWYGMRQHKEAIECFEKSVSVNGSFATAHRNLALLYYNTLRQVEKAMASLMKAFMLDTADARVLMELDQLNKRINIPVKERHAFLNQYAEVAMQRDDLYLEMITLENAMENFTVAKQLLAARIFHPWEGGEGKVTAQFLLCHIELTKQFLLAGEYQAALELIQSAKVYPTNLGEGKLYNTPENDLWYFEGLAYQGLSMHNKAIACFMEAAKGNAEPEQAIFYNDPQPDKVFYKGLALQMLRQDEASEIIFNKLINFGIKHMNDKITIDYFAVSLPDLQVFDADLDQQNKLHCIYIMALGYLGRCRYIEAQQAFNNVLYSNVNHTGAKVHLDMIRFLKNNAVSTAQFDNI